MDGKGPMKVLIILGAKKSVKNYHANIRHSHTTILCIGQRQLCMYFILKAVVLTKPQTTANCIKQKRIRT